MKDGRERLAGVDARRLQEVVRAALGEPGAVLGDWAVAPLKGEIGAGAGGSRLCLLTGTARAGGAEQPWRLVLKGLTPVAGQADPAHISYGRREILLYGSGLLDDLPTGLGAPRCYGCDEQADGTFRLWLEQVREDGERSWPPARWALAARHLG